MSAGKLPEGWVRSELDNILLTIIGGGTPSKAIPDYYKGDIPWMSVKDMNKHILTDTVDHITHDAVENSSTNIIPAGTPIIATRMSLGKIVTASFDSAINQDLKALFLSSRVDRNFFIHWYRSQAQLIESLGTGTTVKGIRLEVLKALSINFPPFPEQKNIADKLDTLLAQVDSTKARLEQIPQILKRFRQAVLAMALNGRSEQSRNPAKIVKLIDVTKKITDGEHLTPKTINSGIPLLSAKDVQEDELLFDNVKYLSDSVAAKALNRCSPEKNDILIVSRGATVGRTHLVSTSEKFCLMGSVLLIKLDTEQVIPEYMKLIFNDISGQQQLVSASGATAQQAIYIRDVKEFSFKLISLNEQHEIVRRVEQLFAYADTIEKQVNNALIRVNNLTQSILAKAFRGELTAQWRAENPDLISGENSAAALLEKIKAERAASGSKKASRKKT